MPCLDGLLSGRWRPLAAASLLLCSAAAVPALAQREPDAATASLAISRPETRTTGRLQVTSPSVKADGELPDRFSDYGGKVSPGLAWTGAPEATKSFVVMMEDPDAPPPKPYVHWLVYGIPATASELAVNLPAEARLRSPAGARQGRNTSGSTGYFGPRPPKLDGPHRYHFQVFALDVMPALAGGADRQQLLKAVAGHVIAAGDLVALFKAPMPK